jgi:hypothetical protein
MANELAKHFAKHTTGSHHGTGANGRLLHGFGGIVSRAIHGASATGELRASSLPRRGRGLPRSTVNELESPETQQLKVLQDIYNLMTGPGINVIVKNPDLQARFG